MGCFKIAEQIVPVMTATLSDADTTTPFPCIGPALHANRTTTKGRRVIHGKAANADSPALSSGLTDMMLLCHSGQLTALNSILEAVKHLPPKAVKVNIRDHLARLRLTIRQPMSAVLKPREMYPPRLPVQALLPVQVQHHVPRSLILNPLFDEADVRHKQTTMQERGDSYQLASAQDQDPLDCLTGLALTSRPA